MTVPSVWLVLLLAGGVPQPKVDWDGPLLPGYLGRALLDEKCESGDSAPPAWRKIDQLKTHGRKRGETLVALARSGEVPLPVKLGRLECLAGECRADYVAVHLDPTVGRDLLALGPLEIFPEGTRVVPFAVVKQGCRPPVPRRKGTVATCTLWRAETLTLETVERKDAEPNQGGWELVTEHARLFDGDKPGPWVEIDAHPSAAVPRPMLAVFAPDGSERILWVESEGIIGPPHLYVRLSRPAPDGGIELGRSFKAGGQPCD